MCMEICWILVNREKTQRITVNKIKLSAPITKSISRRLLSNFGTGEALSQQRKIQVAGLADRWRVCEHSVCFSIYPLSFSTNPTNQTGELSSSRVRSAQRAFPKGVVTRLPESPEMNSLANSS